MSSLVLVGTVLLHLVSLVLLVYLIFRAATFENRDEAYPTTSMSSSAWNRSETGLKFVDPSFYISQTVVRETSKAVAGHHLPHIRSFNGTLHDSLHYNRVPKSNGTNSLSTPSVAPAPPPVAPVTSSQSNIPVPNVFMPLIAKWITRDKDIVMFTGPHVKKLFGAGGTIGASFELTGKSAVRKWGDVAARLANVTSSSPSYSNRAVHFHNEFKLGDLLELVLLEYKKMSGDRHAGPLTEKQMHAVLSRGTHLPIVMTNTVDENWGFLSTGIGTRTARWLNLTNHLTIHRANYDTVQHFLSSDKIALLICNSHVDPLIGYHPKIISLPLGIRGRFEIFKYFAILSKYTVLKTKLLVINNSGWGDRTKINEMVSLRFNRTVVNSYVKNKRLLRQRRRLRLASLSSNHADPPPSTTRGTTDATTLSNERGKLMANKLAKDSPPVSKAAMAVDAMGSDTSRVEKNKKEKKGDSGVLDGVFVPPEVRDQVPWHVLDAAHAKFVLCPSGLGFDTYRLWETLLLGSIPIVESNAGFDRTYSMLPVLVVRDYSQVTPELLHTAYDCFQRYADEWKFQVLQYSYWIRMVKSAVLTGDLSELAAMHPPVNPLCSYL